VRDFLTQTLLRGTQGSVYICSLVNDRGDSSVPVERHILTRDLDHAEEFVGKWDSAGRGIFFSVSTYKPGSRRAKSNALEMVFLHLDIDLKSINITLDEVTEILKGLPKQPTFVVFSGNGLHGYWGFHVAAAARDIIEDLDKRLADILAGDRQVAQRAALMRLPGTHNTKHGKWTEVKVVHASGVYYEIEDLAQWLEKAPVYIARKDATAAKPDEPKNPFLKYAEEYSYAAPVDVEKRLARMEYQGEGDKAVHATQLSVTASMLSSGYAMDEVVDTVMEATRKVAPDGWDWKAEEITVRNMCRDWMRKLVKKEEAVAKTNVVSLADRRMRRNEDDEEEKQQQKGPPKKNIVHVVLGNGFIASLKQRGDGILICREEVWRCTQGLWVSLSPGEAKAWIDRELEEGCRTLGIVSTQKIVSEGRAWVMRNPEIYMENVPWDQHGLIACKSGLLHPVTLQITPIVPEHYVTMRIECEYDPAAKCRVWLQMLQDIFPGEPETVMAIQELAGVGLLLDRPRQLMRALIIVGPSNSGKSNILTTLSGMFTHSPNTTTFDLLENTHGTSDFLRNVPWVLHEAFDQSKWHFSATVKALLSGDPISINIKNGPIVERRFKLPVFWGTNSPPQFKEASRAIENRVRIVRCKQVFDPANVRGIAKEAHDKGFASPADYVLSTEMPGLLNWFIEGMQRAVARGYIADTEEMRQSAKDMRTNSNIVAGFFEDAVDYSSLTMVSMPDLLAAFRIWWEENRGEGRFAPSSDMVSKSIESLYDARIAINSKALRYNTVRYVAGISLNEMGLSLWKANYNATAARGDSARISSREEDVNMRIPEEWYDKKIIKTMVEAHNKGN